MTVPRPLSTVVSGYSSQSETRCTALGAVVDMSGPRDWRSTEAPGHWDTEYLRPGH